MILIRMILILGKMWVVRFGRPEIPGVNEYIHTGK